MSFDLRIPILRGAYHLLRASVPLEVSDPHGLLARADGGEALLFACRHGQLLALLWAMEAHDLTIVASRSRDGELLARILSHYGFGLIRGSSSQNGKQAARQAVRALEGGARLGVAVDGPRGPRGCVQEGVLRIARRAGAPVVPLSVEGGRPWVLEGTWDRFELPRPRQPLTMIVGAPIDVEVGDDGLARAGAAIARELGGWWEPRSNLPGAPEPHPSYGHS